MADPAWGLSLLCPWYWWTGDPNSVNVTIRWRKSWWAARGSTCTFEVNALRFNHRWDLLRHPSLSWCPEHADKLIPCKLNVLTLEYCKISVLHLFNPHFISSRHFISWRVYTKMYKSFHQIKDSTDQRERERERERERARKIYKCIRFCMYACKGWLCVRARACCIDESTTVVQSLQGQCRVYSLFFYSCIFFFIFIAEVLLAFRTRGTILFASC